MKKLGLAIVALMMVVLFAGCNQADEYECMVADSLEEATGLEWEIYELEMVTGKECQANSFFQPDTGAEIYVFKYSETYADISVNFGNLEGDIEKECAILSVMNELFPNNGNMPVLEMEMELGGF